MNQQTRFIFTTISYMQERQNNQNHEIVAEEKPERKFNFHFWPRKQSANSEIGFHPVTLASVESI